MSRHTLPSPSTTGNAVTLATSYFSRLLYAGLVWILAALPVLSAADLVPDYYVTLEWDANSEPDVSGYNLYFGTASGSYSETFDAGNHTEATVPVSPGTTYFFAVTAYNSEGLESPFSNEVTFTAPEPPDLLVENIVPPEEARLKNGIPNITFQGVEPDGGLTFLISARAGQSVRVEASSDLLFWTCRGILENPTGGIVVTDPDAAGRERRFYRVVLEEAK